MWGLFIDLITKLITSFLRIYPLCRKKIFFIVLFIILTLVVLVFVGLEYGNNYFKSSHKIQAKALFGKEQRIIYNQLQMFGDREKYYYFYRYGKIIVSLVTIDDQQEKGVSNGIICPVYVLDFAKLPLISDGDDIRIIPSSRNAYCKNIKLPLLEKIKMQISQRTKCYATDDKEKIKYLLQGIGPKEEIVYFIGCPKIMGNQILYAITVAINKDLLDYAINRKEKQELVENATQIAQNAKSLLEILDNMDMSKIYHNFQNEIQNENELIIQNKFNNE